MFKIILSHLAVFYIGVIFVYALHWREIFGYRELPSDQEEVEWLIKTLNGKE
jgi:hypothetical protein